MNDHQKRAAPGARPGLSKERMEQDFPAVENSPSALETQARAACRDCSFYRVVPLASGRVRRLCMLTGERLTTAATPCQHFQAGRWQEVWADTTDAPRQSFICHLCQHVEPHTRRAVLLRTTLCRLHRPEARSAAPVACPAFRVRRGEVVCHAA